MIQKEISLEYAVRRLRSEIDGGAFNSIMRIFRRIFGFLALLGKLLLLMILTIPILSLFGWTAYILAAALFMGLLGLLPIKQIRGIIAHLHRHGDKCKGILAGTEYPRLTEQYANVDARPMRGTNIIGISGSNGQYYINYGSEPNPHVLVIGSSSSGKTSTIKSFMCRNYLNYGTRFLMIDWNGDNEEWAKQCGATLWKVPENFKINMFKLNGMNHEQRASMVEDALLIAGRMTMLQATKVKNMALRHYMNGSEPTLDGILGALARERRNSLIVYRLSAIWRVVGEEPDLFWKSIFQNNTVISLAGLNESEKAVVAYFVLQRICELFEKEEPGAREKLLVVVDEAWQLLNSSSRLHLNESLAEKVIRVGRRYGFGIMASTQQLGDVPESFINSSSLIFMHNYRQLQQTHLTLNRFDLAYMESAGQGECLVFDRLRSQNGQPYPDYIKIRQLQEQEYNEIRSRSTALEIPSYQASKSNYNLPELPKAAAEPTTVKKSPFRIPEGAPSPMEHAAMLAVYYCTDKDKAGLISYIKEKGWIRSETTLYGYTAKPGVLEGIVNAGFAEKSRDKYALTETGMKWIDPEQILLNQSDKLGSEEHKRLLISTIHKLHDSNSLVITSRIKHSPDLIAWPVHQKKRYLWDTGSVKGYEIQTSARRDSVGQNAKKADLWGISVEWVY